MICTSKRSLGDQMEKNEMGRACHTNGGVERRGAYKVLVGKSDGKRPLGRSRHRWEDSIKMDLQEIGWELGNGLD